MKFLKKLAVATALSSIAFAASAMTPIADTELSQVSGQDGVSIAANLQITIGSFVYSDVAGTEAGGSVSFNNIGINGTIAATLDVMSGTKFFQATAVAPTGLVTAASGEAMGTLGLVLPTTAAGAAALAAFYPINPATGTGSDVVRIAIPNLQATALNMTVGSITMGNNITSAATGTQSFGSFAMNGINLAGTTAYIWAH